MKVTLKNSEIIELYNTLVNLNIPGSVKFKYNIAKNRKLLQSVLTDLQKKTMFEHDRKLEYNERYQQLHQEFSIDKNGLPVTKLSEQKSGTLERVIPEERYGEWMAALEKLKSEFRDFFVALNAHNLMVKKFMEEEQEIELMRIPFKEIPDSISFNQNDFTTLLVLFEPPEDE